MDGGDSSSGMYRPGIEETAHPSQTCTEEEENRCGPVQERDDIQLVGAPVAVLGVPAPLVKSGELPAVAPVEIRPATAGQVVGQVMERRKRGRPPKGQAPRPPPPLPNRNQEEEEDVCFICFDGGSLVLCDRKGCPKAYHPACIKRDESFFRSKAKWNCGWHICSVCRKASHYMCYTCTYSLCKACIKDAEYVCLRGNKGFCMTCMRTIMLIENKDAGNKESIQVDFDDKTSWEYLFKVYWILLKSKLSLTLNELMQAKSPWRGVVATDYKQQSPRTNNIAKSVVVPLSVKSSEHLELEVPKGQPELPNQNSFSTEMQSSAKTTTLDGRNEWASRELLEFVAHMRNGDTSVISQFDVQALLLEYIKRNNLRDPRRKSQIVCDLRLKNLFAKPRVGHIEMLKLLEYHFLIKEDTQKNAFIPAGIVGSVASNVGDVQNSYPMLNQNKKRKTRKKGEERAPQTNLDEYAAIDVHNMNLIYLRRSLMENLLGEGEKFHDKVVGSIVRIRVACNEQKQDIYRLVQVVGTSKVAEPYKIGDKTADVMLEVLNLVKKEAISIDGISNQEFSEDECRRLRQSIKCGLVKRLTVGEIQMKAIALQSVRLDDWLEAEILRLNHLRDRANEKGHKKELRECVEKLQLLKTPEERQRRLTEIPEVHADPKMNPTYESEADATGENDKKLDDASRPRYSKVNTNGRQSIRPKRRVKEDEPKSTKRSYEKIDGHGLNKSAKHGNQVTISGSASGWANQTTVRSSLETSPVTLLTGNSTLASSSDMEKIWHYRDPNGKIQGPFSMVQLRKWSTTGYFPGDMRIWTNNEHDGSLLLTDVLNGEIYKASQLVHINFLRSQESDVASDNKLSAADSWSTFSNGTGSDAKQEVVLRCTDSRVQTGQEGSKLHTINLEQTCLAPLHQAIGHEIEEFNSVRGNESSHVTAEHHLSGVQSPEKSSSSQSYVGQSGQNTRPVTLNLDLNHKVTHTGLTSISKPTDSSKQNGETDILDLPSPTPVTITRTLEDQAAKKQEPMSTDIQAAVNQDSMSVDVPAEKLGISDLPSPTPKHMDDLPSPTPKSTDEDPARPTPKPTDEDLGEQIAETKQLMPSKVSIQDSGWSSTSNLVVGGAQLQEIADEWGGYSPTHAKSSIKEWDSGLVSMSSLKPSEVVGDQVATPNSNSNQLTPSPSHAVTNVSSWQAGVNEPIEFSTLAEESVSDLLAEVDAMESQSGLASPTSGMNCGDEMMDRNDCFSSIEELSPTPDAGKSDALSSTAEIQFPSQPTVIDDPVGASQADAFDHLKRSGGHSTTSSEGETKSADAPVNPREPDSDIHPPAPCSTMNQGMVTPNMARGRGLEAMDTGWPTVQGNMNVGWGGPAQGYGNVGWGPSMGTSWGNPNFNLGAYNGNVAWDSPRRYGGERFAGSRDWAFQGGDMGFGRGRPMWSRQPHGGGGGYSRPPPKGQRVCKFYESGHCKKGASCDYLHP